MASGIDISDERTRDIIALARPQKGYFVAINFLLQALRTFDSISSASQPYGARNTSMDRHDETVS
jgi:hypothetical protein